MLCVAGFTDAWECLQGADEEAHENSFDRTKGRGCNRTRSILRCAGIFSGDLQRKAFKEAGIVEQFVQDNHSMSKHGVLRGLHYQRENAQGKLIRVLAGEIFDVAVDLRSDLGTFGK